MKIQRLEKGHLMAFSCTGQAGILSMIICVMLQVAPLTECSKIAVIIIGDVMIPVSNGEDDDDSLLCGFMIEADVGYGVSVGLRGTKQCTRFRKDRPIIRQPAQFTAMTRPCHYPRSNDPFPVFRILAVIYRHDANGKLSGELPLNRTTA